MGLSLLGCVTKNNLGNDPVEVGVGWSLHPQVPGAQLVDCLYNNLHYTDDSMFGDILASTRLESNHFGVRIRSMSKALNDTRNHYLFFIFKHEMRGRILFKELVYIQRTKVKRAEISRRALQLIEAPYNEKSTQKKPLAKCNGLTVLRPKSNSPSLVPAGPASGSPPPPAHPWFCTCENHGWSVRAHLQYLHRTRKI